MMYSLICCKLFQLNYPFKLPFKGTEIKWFARLLFIIKICDKYQESLNLP